MLAPESIERLVRHQLLGDVLLSTKSANDICMGYVLDTRSCQLLIQKLPMVQLQKRQ